MSAQYLKRKYSTNKKKTYNFFLFCRTFIESESKELTDKGEKRGDGKVLTIKKIDHIEIDKESL